MADEVIGLVPIGAHISNTSLSSAATLTPPSGADRLEMQAIAQNVRYTTDGTTPTSTTGFQLAAIAGNDPIGIDWVSGISIKVIEETSGAAIQAQWYRKVRR